VLFGVLFVDDYLGALLDPSGVLPVPYGVLAALGFGEISFASRSEA